VTALSLHVLLGISNILVLPLFISLDGLYLQGAAVAVEMEDHPPADEEEHLSAEQQHKEESILAEQNRKTKRSNSRKETEAETEKEAEQKRLATENFSLATLRSKDHQAFERFGHAARARQLHDSQQLSAPAEVEVNEGAMVVASVTTEEEEEEQRRLAEHQQRIVEAEAEHHRTRNTRRNEAEAEVNLEVDAQREARGDGAVAHLRARSREEEPQRQAALAQVAAPAEREPRQLMTSLQAAQFNVPVLMPVRAYEEEEEEEEEVSFQHFDEESIDEAPADDLSVQSMHSFQSIDTNDL
jgi:hypothetical protein